MDVERLLGSLLKTGLGKQKASGGLRRAAFSRQGLTLLAGIGIAAYEHYRSRQTAAQPQAGGGDTAPPIFPGASGPAMPPPFPGTGSPMPSAPPPLPEPDLLLRAMVLAALADGVLDSAEREALTDHLERDGITAEERAHLGQLLADPGTIDDLAARVKDPGTAAEVWAAARLAIDPDSQAEQDFLVRLGDRLGLDQDARDDIEARLEEAGA
ncbi:tellurite resistance TerB family protein [Indioceanicola profundi]|uniref:tellurite resistance TerB family protein n=1 Tax=Indioceanicola profundi TaxID=2220096 RepID=UPI000E6AE249|nr:DUF533 domain-containing protein [Indioceanicola profundi]